MPQVESFDPVIGTNPRVLILGSMPGVASLNAQQYYAHPRNGFWPIMSQLFEIEWLQQYEGRIKQFKTLPLALWDVLRSCRRQGSLDADIAQDQLVPNEIPRLLKQYSSISMIAFNGATAERIFKHKIALSITDIQRQQLVRLPSTSPAHASKTLQQKIHEWRVIRTHVDTLE